MTVNVVSVSSGKMLGTMKLNGESVELSDASVARIFNSLKKAYRGTVPDSKVLADFASGWSNGYVKTVQA